MLGDLERRILWLASWMIHNANHLRPSRDGLKVGGHQASCASASSIMAALFFKALRPQDRIAVKPHAAPVLHAINYLLGTQKLEKLQAFRQATSGAIPLIAVGGIDSGAEAYARIRAGASLVQLYSAMVYAGPGLPVRILRDLAALLRRDGYGSTTEAVGAG